MWFKDAFLISIILSHVFIKFLLQRIKRISDYLEGGLHKSFKSGLKNNDKNSVTQCLRIFTTLGRVDQSEQLFADAIIAPIIDEVFARAISNLRIQSRVA